MLHLHAALPGLTLPPAIAAARGASAWPLGPDVAPPPMRYQRLDVMRRVRTSSEPLRTPEAEAIAADIEGAIASLGGSDHARVAVALLLLGGSGVDECHDLVTPLSWPDGTGFGGPAVDGSAAASEATYAHALVHRAEGRHIGEYGTGWHNSAFWFGQLSSRPLPLLFERARAAVSLAAGRDASSAEASWCAENLATAWAPRVLNGLCNAAHDAGSLSRRLRVISGHGRAAQPDGPLPEAGAGRRRGRGLWRGGGALGAARRPAALRRAHRLVRQERCRRRARRALCRCTVSSTARGGRRLLQTARRASVPAERRGRCGGGRGGAIGMARRRRL